MLVGASACKGPHPEWVSVTVKLPELVALQKGVPTPQALMGKSERTLLMAIFSPP